MDKYAGNPKAWTWLVAALAAGLMAGCGNQGDDGQIFGNGGGAGGAGPAGAAPVLGAAAAFGGFGGGAGMTNQGTSTVIAGAQGQPVSIGTTGASTTMTGFHDNSVAYTPPPAAAGCTYTETTSNTGAVNGTIVTDAPPPTITCPLEGTAATMASATAAAAAALAAFNDLAGRPGAIDPGANLGGLTLAPGIYKTASGAFLLTGSDLTLDAGGNANAVWVFQMASTLTVGAAGAPRSVILAGGAQPKNVFWQVGSSATINAAGGGTMVGTIISSAATTISTPGNLAITTLNGRALALNASVTMVNTVINVPAP
jgi:Ice-binding-like